MPDACPADHLARLTRRQFFGQAATGIGTLALASMLRPDLAGKTALPPAPHFAPRAKRMIYLFMHSITSRVCVRCTATNCRIQSGRRNGSPA